MEVKDKIMNYNEFLNTLRTELKMRTNPGTQILLQKVSQNNKPAADVLSILPKDKDITPSIYVDEYYSKYQNGVSLGEIVDEILELYRIHMIEPPFDITRFHDFDKIKPTLVYKLINYERNLSLLERVPHRPFLDLAVVCYFMVEDEAFGTGTIMVYNEYLSLWKITENELFAAAEENTPRLLPPVLRPLQDLMKDLLDSKIEVDYGNPEKTELREELEQEKERLSESIHGNKPVYPVYVLSNRMWKNGASVILYPDVLSDFSKNYCSDFYVIPCSVHEVLILPGKPDLNPAMLDAMIQTINHSDVSVTEQLSNHIYHYNAETGRLE